jgi:hypothetical protein
MKFAHSFWSKPLLENKFNNYTELMPVVLSEYAYSATCVHKNGHTIKLFADKLGAEMLSFIDYDEVIIIENTENWSIHFAAQIKFEALKRMKLDEILIDGDLFMRFQEAYIFADRCDVDFIYSFFENNKYIFSDETKNNYYNKMRSILLKHEKEFKSPYILDRNNNLLEWYNTSFMRFNNQELKDEYIRQYEYHKSLLQNEDFEDTWPDVIIEQRHMVKLVKSKKYIAIPMCFDYPNDRANKFAVRIGFVHMGSIKIKYKETVFKWLKELNEPLYEKTLKHIETYKNKPL